jgi:hypothetical protein
LPFSFFNDKKEIPKNIKNTVEIKKVDSAINSGQYNMKSLITPVTKIPLSVSKFGNIDGMNWIKPLTGQHSENMKVGVKMAAAKFAYQDKFKKE